MSEEPVIQHAGPRPQAPSARIVTEAAQILYAKVERINAPRLGIRQPDILAQFRFTENMGPVISQNQAWMNMCIPLLFLVEFDGRAIRAPMTKREVEAQIKILGNDGYAELSLMIAEHFGEQTGDDAEEGAPANGTLKNS